ncbi:MAG: hypothetical protein PUJ51_13485 [Clostridiales bacterium]|uniref:hypothetical protein n=1 Tax=Terrisporobacter sp. TaxID=1965305 RepID=UPI002A53310F|nr:hypothetical protein [Terrisporobacter sp.]MDD7755498.1 hypothetical protein [Clostridiales bacterium]MDY4133920.1 hypothetical protein [Terrisporobacter sp.]
MAYPVNYAGKLNANEIFASIYNMIISQQVFADNIKDTKASLVDAARVDGSMYGDTKLYYATDVLRSYAWGGDAEASKLLELDRPEDPECQAITLDVFRQIRLTVDNYLTKRAWSSENAFNEFNSVMLGWIRDTKRVYDSTTYNTFIGTYETSEGKQTQTVTLPTVEGDKEAENRLQAQTIATKVADILVDLEDVSRDYNDYQNLRSYSADDFRYVWNSAYVNKINKLDVPTIFHKDGLIDKFAQYTLPARYFGDVVVKGTAVTSDGTSYRSLVEQDVTLVEALTYKGKTLPVGSKFHLFAGDIIPNKIALASASAVLVPSYKENSNIICKIVHKDAVPYMSGFEAGTSFFNSRSLTENNYLTFGHNTLEAIHDKPFITLKVSA